MKHPRSFQRLAMLLAALTPTLHLASCGGSDSSAGGCEQVSRGASSVTVKNDLASGLEAYFPQFAFGADMASGECDIVGLEYSAASVDVRVELRQCTNSASDTNCSGKTFGAARVQTITLPRGESRTIVVNAATFK